MTKGSSLEIGISSSQVIALRKTLFICMSRDALHITDLRMPGGPRCMWDSPSCFSLSDDCFPGGSVSIPTFISSLLLH